MYFKKESDLGLYLFSGKGRTKVSNFIKTLDVQMAWDTIHKLSSDAHSKSLNEVSNAHLNRLKRLKRKIKKDLEANKFPDRVSTLGNKIQAFSLPTIQLFFQYNHGLSIHFQNGYQAVLSCSDRRFIATYVEGDVVEYTCRDQSSFSMELNSILEFMRDS